MAAISSTTVVSSPLTAFFKTGLLEAPLHPQKKYKHKDIDFARFVLTFVDLRTCKALSLVNRKWYQLATPLFKFLRLFSEEHIPGAYGKYSLKRAINRSEAREIFTQTGLELSIPAGQTFLKDVCMGRGQFGEFRIGYDLTRNKYVGIKVVRECEHVESEIMIQQTLVSHSHILPAIDNCQAISPEGVISLYQIMELAGLGNVDRLNTSLSSLEDHSFQEMIHYWLALGLIQGLGEMHKVGICHMDIKPSNCVIRQDGEILIIDFGCATKMTYNRLNIKDCDGDMDFYAPERWLAERFSDRRICDGTKVDMWAAGLTLLSLIGHDIKTSFGKKTMSALVIKPNAEAALTQHVIRQLASQSAFRTPASDSLEDLILHLLHPDPNTRFTAITALEHPWCRKMALATTPHREKISGYLREFVQSQQKKLHSHPKTFSKTPIHSALSPQELPLPHFTSSVDRPMIQAELVKRVFSFPESHYLSAAPITACQGIGGVGKTYLLTQFIHQPKVRDRFGLKLWFNESDHPQGVKIQLMILAREIGLINENTSEEDAIHRLNHYLSNYPREYGKPWLAIFDNAETFDSLKALLPTTGGHILVSTRFPWTGSIPIDVLSEHEAQTLVSKLLFRHQDSHSLDLCRILGYHPLGIVQACAYLRNHQLSIPVFLEELAGNTAFIERDERLFGKNLPNSVSGLWQMTFEKIRMKSPKAFETLELYAYLAPNHLPALIESTPEVMALLKSYALIQGKEQISIHQLLQMAIRAKHSLETQIDIIEKAMKQLFQIHNGDPLPEAEEVDRLLLPHGEALLSHYMKLPSSPRLQGSWALTILWMNCVQHAFISPLKQRELLEKALSIMTHCYEGKIVALAYNRLALVYGKLGEYKLAIEYSEQQLAIEKRIGLKEEDVPLVLNNLGKYWNDLAEHQRALAYHKSALAAFKKKYGEIHPYVAMSLHNLGQVWYEMGQYQHVIRCEREALAIKQKIYGNRHLDTAISLNDLGRVYNALDEYNLAIEFYEQALAIHVKICGMKHPQTAMSLNNIGMVWSDLGQHQKAIEYFEQALTIYNKYYNPDHPSIGTTLNNLGLVYHRMGNKDKAIEYHKRALELFRKRDNKKDIARSLNNLGGILKDLGKLELAIIHFEQALIIWHSLYGEEHPYITNVLMNLGIVSMQKRRFLNAIDYLERALLNLIKVHGEQHARVILCLDLLGNACVTTNRNHKAIEYFERALLITRKMHGELHKDVFLYLNNLGIACDNVGDISKAEDYLTQAYQLSQKLPNLNHSEVITCKRSLDLVLKAKGHDELNDSEPLLEPKPKEGSCCCTIS